MSTPGADTAAEVLAHALSRAPTLGGGRLVAVDGPAGSGKSTLARRIAALAAAPLLRLDDLYPGWDGLTEVNPHVVGVLRPLAGGRTGHYRRYDWIAGEYQEEHAVSPAPLLVVEGVGAGNRAWADLVTTLVWVEAPATLRLERAVARDGEDTRAQLKRWMAAEDRLFAVEGTRDRADFVLLTG